MGVYSNKYYGYNGATSFTAPELTYVTPLCVKRQGLVYEDAGVSAPGNMQFRYTAAEGKIEFADGFIGEPDPASQVDTVYETIFVLYRS